MSALRTRAAVFALAVVAGVASLEGSAAAGAGSPARTGTSVSRAVSVGPASSSATRVPTARIVRPRHGSRVPVRVTANGTGRVQRGTYLWLVVWSPTAHRWYPQQSVRIDRSGRWSGTVHFGTPATRRGEVFGLIVFQASPAANTAMERYLAQGRRTGRWPGMVTMPFRVWRLAGIAVRRR